MAYDFLGLVNDVNSRLNEVPLNSSNFGTAGGFYSAAKESVNSAIRFINQSAFEWPFNHTTQSLVLTPGTNRYSYPSNVKTIDFDSFRIVRDDTLGNDTRKLSILSYEDYLDNYLDDEYNTSNTSIRTIPRHVFRTPDRKFGVHPVPDKAYTLVYESYALSPDLVDAADTPALPEQFRNVIVDGAMHFAYFFRGNTQDASLHFQKFEEGIKNMRSLYINRYDYIRDTRVNNSYVTNPRVS
jgi:hypothetical protein